MVKWWAIQCGVDREEDVGVSLSNLPHLKVNMLLALTTAASTCARGLSVYFDYDTGVF